MELNEFFYELPPSLIASHPGEDRAGSRLLVLDRQFRTITHTKFESLGEFLTAGDLLVLNDSEVLPVRLVGKKASGGTVEVLLLEPYSGDDHLWTAMVDCAKKPQLGSRLLFPHDISATVIGIMGEGRYGLEFFCQGDFMEALFDVGEPPLPPYIHRTRKLEKSDWQRYQTVYASSPGSVAAPTAGLHFTPKLFERLESMGVGREFLTLHVGPGTFQPIRSKQVEFHRMEGERYTLSKKVAQTINGVKKHGNRVIAVGSTSTRTLEGIAQKKGRLVEDHGLAHIFIRPGFTFRVIDGLITNFHLPGSTPLLLVAAFAGMDLMRQAYDEAIRLKYRFYSYGDAMLIL